MILERQRELTINMGNQTYESIKISAKVSIDTEKDLPTLLKFYSDDLDVSEIADKELTKALAAEVEYWHEITTKRDSFIHLVWQDNNAKDAK